MSAPKTRQKGKPKVTDEERQEAVEEATEEVAEAAAEVEEATDKAGGAEDNTVDEAAADLDKIERKNVRKLVSKGFTEEEAEDILDAEIGANLRRHGHPPAAPPDEGHTAESGAGGPETGGADSPSGEAPPAPPAEQQRDTPPSSRHFKDRKFKLPGRKKDN